MNKTAWVVLIILLVSITSAGVYYGGYRRSDDVSSVPCLGCLGLDPVARTQFRYKTKGEHPDFVTDALERGVVFLHYRTDACPACDEMEPVIDEIEEETPQVEFFHINLDHAKGEKKSSVFTYDIEAQGNDITGVPMFVIMTKNRDDGVMKPYYKVLYGIHSKEDIMSDITKALELYPSSEEFTPMVDLFVDKYCGNCPFAEEALVDMYDDSYFISYVTDAPGVSGNYSEYLEKQYQGEYGGYGHPRAEFNAGEKRKLGAEDGVITEYRNITRTLDTSAGDVELTVSMDKVNSGYDIGYELVSQASEEYRLRVVVADRYSPWSNSQGERIPFAFIDNIFNTTMQVEGGETVSDEIYWSGTDEVSLDELGTDLALFGIVYEQGEIVQTAHIPPDVGEIQIEVDEDELAVSPSEVKHARSKVINGAKEDLDITVKAEDELGWILETPDPFTLEAGKNETITVGFECPIDSTLGDQNQITVKFDVEGEEYLSKETVFTVEVKEDSQKPQIGTVSIDPEDPKASDEIKVEVIAVDNEGLKKVEISYYVCTDVLCSPVWTEEMDKSGNEYSATIGPFDEKYTELHFTVRAEDINGNVNETKEYGFYF
ncbi:MAG: thioredoxin family protein [Thermoplasmatota archaeon]